MQMMWNRIQPDRTLVTELCTIVLSLFAVSAASWISSPDGEWRDRWVIMYRHCFLIIFTYLFTWSVITLCTPISGPNCPSHPDWPPDTFSHLLASFSKANTKLLFSFQSQLRVTSTIIYTSTSSSSCRTVSQTHNTWTTFVIAIKASL